MREGIKEFWDDCHNKELVRSLSGCSYNSIVKALHLQEYIKTSDTVLEMGVGLGGVVKGFYEENKKVSGLDISEVALDKVSEWCENIYTVAAVNNLPINYFDIIVSANVVQHIDTSLLKKELKYLIRALKNTGVFAVEFVTNNNISDMGINPCLETLKGGSCCRTPEVFKQLVKEAGGRGIVIESLDCDNEVVHSCHVMHIFKEKHV